MDNGGRESAVLGEQLDDKVESNAVIGSSVECKEDVGCNVWLVSVSGERRDQKRGNSQRPVRVEVDSIPRSTKRATSQVAVER